jgi:hypothetical protein
MVNEIDMYSTSTSSAAQGHRPTRYEVVRLQTPHLKGERLPVAMFALYYRQLTYAVYAREHADTG